MKVGYYVRANCGIAKIKYFETKSKSMIRLDKDVILDTDGCKRDWCATSEIIKSSADIKDLIEKQDIIKYNPIQNHYVKKQILYKAIKDERDLLFLQHQVKNDKLKILEILTHEQFEENAYKVGDE